MTRLSALLAIFALGCQPSDADGPNPDRVARVVTSPQGDTGVVVGGHNAFTWDLYADLREGAGEGNVFFSPFSVTSALGMTLAGANGDTEAEMKTVLGVEGDEAAWHGALGALTRDLSGDLGRGYTLHVANRLFGQADFTFEEDFLGICEDDYGAPLESLDFVADPEAARERVNDWVASQTADRIQDLLPQGSVTGDTRLVLANAIYFLADWASAFDPEQTSDAGFTKLDGETVTVPMMHMDLDSLETHGVEAGWSEGVAVLRLPYQDDEVSMVLLVPDAHDGLPDLEAGLDAARWQALTADLTPASVPIGLPRFELEFEADLGAALSGLGMPTAFSDGADFTGIAADGGLSISGVYHKAFVKVDEAGTEAAAATGVVVGVTSAPMPIVADRPFLFAIQDDLTGALLFVGRVTDPR